MATRPVLPEIARDEAGRVAAGVEAQLDLLLSDLETWVNGDPPGRAERCSRRVLTWRW